MSFSNSLWGKNEKIKKGETLRKSREFLKKVMSKETATS